MKASQNHNDDGTFCQGNRAGTLRTGPARPKWARGFVIPSAPWGDVWRGYRIAVSGLGTAVVVLVHKQRTRVFELPKLDDVRWLVAQLRAAGLRRISRGVAP